MNTPRTVLRVLGATVAVAALLAGVAQTAEAAPPITKSADAEVIVRGKPGQEQAVSAAVERLGGRVTRPLGIIDGVAASVPASSLAVLRADPAVAAVTADATGHVLGIDPALGYDRGDTGSLANVADIVGARALWAKGITGKGVDVALIDTGVAPVPGLDSGNVINGPDLSFDSPTPAARYVDGYGHGTHMASIIAGRDAVLSGPAQAASTGFAGIAPDARLVNIKVGAADGSADVSQVIAAIEWVTTHARDNGLNIRVLNLSYGTDSNQPYQTDPLSFAVEAAWRQGILVVVAGGNDGTRNRDLANPARDPNVLAVGAEDPQGTLRTSDDTIAEFADRGTLLRRVDVVAPGVHVLGLKVPGSAVDAVLPSVKVGDRFVRGSGTSQAAAVTSGAAALLLSSRPSLTPVQAKAVLRTSATPLSLSSSLNAGAGLVNATAAVNGARLLALAGFLQPVRYGTGTGSLEAARGTQHVEHGGTVLDGERDVFGRAWDPSAATTWQDGAWRGSTMTGAGWVDEPTDGALPGWASSPWSGSAWSSEDWSSPDWQQGGWDGRTWIAGGWDGRTWIASTWTGRTWIGRTWVGASWSGAGWN